MYIFLGPQNFMILIIEDYYTPAEKVQKILFPNKPFTEIKKVDQECFRNLYELSDKCDCNFFIRLEWFSTNEIDKIKFYFDQIYEVDKNLLRYLNKKKRLTKLYEILRSNVGITEIKEIKENVCTGLHEMSIGQSAKPYMDAQDEEIVLYPSDEE